MVSFQCEGCGDVFTKKKLDAHANRCRGASFTCLDCHTQFFNYDYRSHTSCISEAQKYQGALYQEKKPKQRQARFAPATVEDVDSATNTPRRMSLTGQDIPPPKAPTPPPAATPLNVFDYLVKENERKSAEPASASSTTSTSSSSYLSANDSDRSPSPQTNRAVPPARDQQQSHAHSQTPTQAQSKPHLHPHPQPPGVPGQYPPNYHMPQAGYGYVYQEPVYTYGTGPIKPSQQRYNSTQDFGAQMQQVPYPQYPHPPAYIMQTPGQPNKQNPYLDPASESRSDKKRKRSPMQEPKTVERGLVTTKERLLHSGLTDGLKKMVPDDESDRGRAREPSPLSPKKRSKRSRQPESDETESRQSGKSRYHKSDEPHKSKHGEKSDRSVTSDKEIRRRRAIEAPPTRKAIEYPGSRGGGGRRVTQAPHLSHSEFFLSLIDKDHHSVKGQSVWGALKMFHEGRQERSGHNEDANRAEEKRLLRGLRCKINKHGEIVLFSRPEAED